jgi:hypothetical protein
MRWVPTKRLNRARDGDNAWHVPEVDGVGAWAGRADGVGARAEGAGAKIVRGIRQTGFRAYTAQDLEGYEWTFAQAPPG